MLEPWETTAIRYMLSAKLDELHGVAFEDFFHKMMCARHDDFLDVYAAGTIGDRGSDGLLLSDGKLYACYAPKVFNAYEVTRKLRSDLDKAARLRADEFAIFVFVHNNRSGVHPVVSTALTEARKEYGELRFENFGHHRFVAELCQLERFQIEDLLGPFPAEPVVSGVVLADLIPLLDHLAESRRPLEELLPVPRPSAKKIDYNGFSPDVRHRMRHAMTYVQHVDAYYAGRRHPAESDEVAQGFRTYYEYVTSELDDPDDVLWELEQHILGNARPSSSKGLDALVVLMYFFGRCDIFEAPPPGWAPSGQAEGAM